MKTKLTSRKFWLAVSGMITGILMLFGVAETTVEKIAALIVVIADTVAYIFAEAEIDKERSKQNEEANE